MAEPICDFCGITDKQRCRRAYEAQDCPDYNGPALIHPLPEGPFDVILADPPWKFASNSKANPGRNAMRHYDCMTLDDICDMPVKTIAAKDALLLMWVTAPFAELAFRVVKAWGFSYKSQLVWPKQRVGTGFWARNRHEPVYVCERGDGVPVETRDGDNHDLVYIARRGGAGFPCQPNGMAPFPDSVIPGAQREHSRKPEWVHEQVEAQWPSARKLELFSRERRAGWDVWGNETEKFSKAEPAVATAFSDMDDDDLLGGAA